MADRAVEPLTTRVSEAFRHEHVPMLAVVSGGWFLSLGVRLVYPVLLPHLRTAYSLDLTTAGLLLTVLWLAYALGQVPAGILADRIGEGRVLTLSCFLAAGMLLVVVLADSAVALFTGTAALALGLTLYGVARFVILADLFPENVGTATGITLAAGDAGNAILPPIAGVLAVTVAWQAGFGVLVPAFALAGVACWIYLPAATSQGTSAVDALSVSTARDILASLYRPVIVRGTAALLVGNAVWQAFTGFYPTYLVQVKGLSPTAAGAIFGGFFAMGILVKPLAGRAYDRAGIRRSLALIGGVMAASLATLPYVTG
ncbi:MAG: nitrate/nitrite transporter, partial [Salinirussus sp.]